MPPKSQTKDAIESYLNNPRNAASFLSKKSFEFLTQLQATITEVIAAKQVEEAEAIKEREAKREKLEKLKNYMVELGLTAEDVVPPESTEEKKPHVRTPAKPKYEILLDNGEIKQWSGRGKTPSAFKEALEQGHDLSEYLIKTTES